MTDEQREMYQVYMDTRGNKAYFGNPFSFNWQSQVSCLYGWRVHPINHNLQLHRGLDLAEPLGTPIHSVQAGKVVKIGYDRDGFGNYVSVEDDEGYRSTYAHCDSVTVHEGQIVTLGEIIATVGNTGVSTGSHLHLELVYHGEYLNPYFFIESEDS
jgi:murein DD-endopeptidase MepM/ murein hydrolase activator NlpD